MVIASDRITGIEIIRYVVGRDIGEIHAEILLTGLTIVKTELQVAHDAAHAFHKRLFYRTPCKRDCREDTPTVLLGEAGGGITSKGERDEITVLEPIVDTSEERHKLIRSAPIPYRATHIAVERLTRGIHP